jgi:hypothetical protein
MNLYDRIAPILRDIESRVAAEYDPNMPGQYQSAEYKKLDAMRKYLDKAIQVELEFYSPTEEEPRARRTTCTNMIYIGPKGGRYRIHKGKKVYVK